MARSQATIFDPFPLASSPLASSRLAVLAATVLAPISAPAVAELVDLGPQRAFGILRELEAASLVERTGRGKATRWRITRAGLTELGAFLREINAVVASIA